MSEQRLELYRTLARGLIWAAALVFALAIVVAISIATSDSQLGFGNIEREGRGIAALTALGAGIAAAAALAALGAILDLLLERRVEAPAPAESSAASEPGGSAGPDQPR